MTRTGTASYRRRMGMRPRHELEAEHAAAIEERTAFAGDARLRESAAAVVDALAWVLGLGPAPITGVPGTAEVSAADVGREINVALDVLYGRARHPEHDVARPYASGVEHALLWASCATSDPPVSVPIHQ